MRSIRIALSIVALLAFPALAWAGISKFDPAKGVSREELRSYKVAYVEDFKDAVEGKLEDAEAEARHRETIKEIQVKFADKIAERLTQKGRFDTVTRQPVEGRAVIIGGRIINVKVSNAAARYTGVFGRSHLEAVIEARDAETGKPLGEIEVDLKSSPIPGGTNVIMTVSGFVDGAATRATEEILIANGQLRREQTGRQGRLREKYTSDD
jgi:hypothetical protein